MAYWLFEHQSKELSEVEYRLFHQKYEEKYGIRINRDRLFETLRESAILAGGGQEFRFKYPYYYYYFVARYFRDNMQSAKIRDQIRGLLVKLQKPEHANIWIILTHLSKDPFLVDSILAHARMLFEKILPSEFGKDVEFLLGFYEWIPKIVLEDKTPQEMREIRRKQQEEEHRAEAELAQTEATDELSDFVNELNSAIKTIEVLGQIVRNFPGSIVGETKYQLVKECYELGMRVMGVFVNMWRDAGEKMITQAVDLILEKHTDIKDREELTKLVKSFLFTFLEMVGLSMMKIVSHAVGAAALVETYEKVEKATPTRAVKLINVSVKLDTIGVPKKEILDLSEQMRDNVFCQELLRQLVIHHFYLFHTDPKVKQALCDRLGIEFRKLTQGEAVRMGQKRLPN